jgi:hypothetical protein
MTICLFGRVFFSCQTPDTTSQDEATQMGSHPPPNVIPEKAGTQNAGRTRNLSGCKPLRRTRLPTGEFYFIQA